MPCLVRKLAALFLWSPCNWITFPNSSSSITVPLQANSFLKALITFFKSIFALMPWTVVKHLRPFLCWTRIWTMSFGALAASSFSASAKGSKDPPRFCIWSVIKQKTCERKGKVGQVNDCCPKSLSQKRRRRRRRRKVSLATRLIGTGKFQSSVRNARHNIRSPESIDVAR